MRIAHPPILRRAIVADVAPIVIRPIRDGEFTALGDLTVAAYRAVPGGATTAGYEDTLRDVAARAAAAEVLVAVAADGTVLGGVAYVPEPGRYAEFEGDDEAGIRMLAVAPAAQGQGVGRRLVAECIGRAEAAGRARIVLHTTDAMTAAQSLYGSLGFERTPQRDLVVGAGMSLLAYVLALTPAR
jgi:ribosomal protein S18 acetylase RimI-like enzyme